MKWKAIVSGAILSVALAVPAQAAPITGVLDFAGEVTVTPTDIIWEPPSGTYAGYGEATIQGSSTGTFAGLGGVTVHEMNLNAAAFPLGFAGGLFAPVDNFEIIEGLENINFVLEAVAACPEIGGGSVCPVAGSPFGFDQNLGGTEVTLVMRGIVYDTNTPTLVSTWLGIWTAQFPGQTIAQVLNDFNTQGFIDTSFSASKITVQTPEPAMLALFGIGLLGGGYRARRRRQ